MIMTSAVLDALRQKPMTHGELFERARRNPDPRIDRETRVAFWSLAVEGSIVKGTDGLWRARGGRA